MTNGNSQMIPQNEDIEKFVLGALLIDCDAYDVVSSFISEDSFYNYNHKCIFRACKQLVDNGKPIDFCLLSEELKKEGTFDKVGGIEYIIGLSTSVASSANVEYHARALCQLQKARQVIDVTSNLLKNASQDGSNIEELIQQAEDGLFDIQKTESENIVSLNEVSADFLKDVYANRDGEGVICFPTGIPIIDHRTGGLHPSDLVILAARTSSGKSVMATDIAMETAKSHMAVGFISLEMTYKQLYARMISHISRVSASNALYMKLSNGEVADIEAAVAEVSQLNPYFKFCKIESPTLTKLKAEVRKLIKVHHCKLIVVDYLQILMCTNSSQTDARFLGDVARALKDIAKNYDVCILALSQYSRNSSFEEPTLADIRSSGEIAEAADTVISIHRPEAIEGYPYKDYHSGNGDNVDIKGTAKITILKGRNIGGGSCYMKFDANHTHFYATNDLPQTCCVEQVDDRPF